MGDFQLLDTEDESILATGDSLEEITEQLELKTGRRLWGDDDGSE